MDHAAQFLVTKGGSSEKDSSASDSGVNASDSSSTANQPATAAVP
jgi:hypothetical protein